MNAKYLITTLFHLYMLLQNIEEQRKPTTGYNNI